MYAHENDRGIYFIPFGYAVVVFGIIAFTLGTFGPDLGVEPGRGWQAAVVMAGVFFIVMYHRIASSIMERWFAHNDMLIAQMEHNTELLGTAPAIEDDGADPDPADAAEDDDIDDRLQVNTKDGSYSMQRLTSAERQENARIGDGLQFIAIGVRSKGFSLRAMMPNRPVGMSENKFEKWWTAQTDQLVTWGLFEKVGRVGTGPTGGRSIEDVRRALLQRDFKRDHQISAMAGQAGQGQTA